MTQNRRPVRPGGSGSPAPRPAAPRPAPQRPAARPRAPLKNPFKGVQLPYDFWPLLLAGVLLIALCILLQAFWPNLYNDTPSTAVSSAVAEIHGKGPIRLNELMSSNSATLVDENGLTADWIEVMNVGNSAVNLEGYTLGKTENSANVFVFPNHTLQPGECVIVFADSTLRSEAGSDYHAPFRLSSQGGTLMLFGPSGSAIDSVNFPAIVSDSSYVRVDAASWDTSSQPTPGLANTEESYRALHEVTVDAGVEITELVASNSKYAPDENGVFHDYIELHNTTGAAIDLSGWFLSDVSGQPTKWRIPDGFVLQAGEYRIIHASGMDRASAEHPHTSFGLSSEGEMAILADSRGRLVDEVKFDLLRTNEAWLKQPDGNWSVGTPTPNAAN